MTATNDVDAIIRPFVLGLATGARGSAGVTAAAYTCRGSGPVSRRLTSTWGKRLLAAFCAGELVGDKLPRTPSRLDGPGFPFRVVGSALSGLAVAERDGADPAATALLVVAGASLGAVVGAGVRGVAARRGWSDLPVALAEDLVTALFVFIGVAGARDHA